MKVMLEVSVEQVALKPSLVSSAARIWVLCFVQNKLKMFAKL